MENIITALILVFVNGACAREAFVNISQGVVRGVLSDDASYSMYLGIPYATVDPDNPFGEPLPALNFDEVFDANNDGTRCPQIEEFNNTLTGTIDCLDLNVYVPNSASDDNLLPVMVYIFGGRFALGFPSRYIYGPQYLVRHGVVLVTINYRLGSYGWMCLDTPSVPGNNGLKDQRRALRWINENIAAFGGDPNSVTIFGNSAGSSSVELHILTPYAGDLFHRAILQSGSALGHDVLRRSQPRQAIDLCEYLSLNASTTEEAIYILKDIPSNDIVTAEVQMGLEFRPCIEKAYEGVENIVTDLPEKIMSGGNFTGVPTIQGYNEQEVMILSHMLHKDEEGYFESLKDVVINRLNLSYNFADDKILRDVSRRLHEFYFGTHEVSEETLYELIDFDSDIYFLHPIERSISHRLKLARSPIYQYVFAYTGALNFSKRRFKITVGGASHADELGYLFKQEYVPDEISAEDQLTIDRMTTMWTNFAKYGNPTPQPTSLLPVPWRPASQNRSYLWIDSELQLKKKPFHRRIAMWDLVFEAYKQFFRYF